MTFYRIVQMKLFVLPWANKCWDLSIKTVKFEIWPCVCTCTIVCIVRMFCTVSLKCDLVYVFVPFSVHCVCTCTIVCIVRRKSWKKNECFFLTYRIAEMKLFVLPCIRKRINVDLSIKTVKFEMWSFVCSCIIVCIVRMSMVISVVGE